jgi:DNA-binding NarL/FixJ family response regulator
VSVEEARMISVLVAEDEEKMQARLRRVIEAETELELSGVVASLSLLKESLAKSQPDVLLLDLALKDGNSIDAIGELVARSPATRILVLTIFDDEDSLIRALGAGAKGYVLKDEPDELLVQEIKTLHLGGSPLTSRLAEKLISLLEPEVRGPQPLTGRQLEILRMIALGFHYKDIAESLHISPLTVRTHIRNIYDVLEVSSKSEAILLARRRGILSFRRWLGQRG